MPLALLEAMIAGVPIVSTPWLGARTMLGDGRYGFLTADFTPTTVAAEIQRAVKYPGIRKAIAERASAYVRETYDIARMVDAHRQMYLQLRGAAS
jgi:glycosyltransferase involved in cell wall biosynthesis